MNNEFYIPGQVALITGGNVGIGRITAIELAKKGFKVVIAGRSLERTQPVLNHINSLGVDEQAIFLPLDLASFASVRECARLFLQLNLPLHLLVNNAGVAGLRGLTKDGFEITFGVNHLGHFLLTQLLLEKMQSSGLSRIVTVSSRAHNEQQVLTGMPCVGLQVRGQVFASMRFQNWLIYFLVQNWQSGFKGLRFRHTLCILALLTPKFGDLFLIGADRY
jgi:NAD(P)-dependent dehydrogenase (short-subunit alcohol dehydrogenase family)